MGQPARHRAHDVGTESAGFPVEAPEDLREDDASEKDGERIGYAQQEANRVRAVRQPLPGEKVVDQQKRDQQNVIGPQTVWLVASHINICRDQHEQNGRERNTVHQPRGSEVERQPADHLRLEQKESRPQESEMPRGSLPGLKHAAHQQ